MPTPTLTQLRSFLREHRGSIGTAFGAGLCFSLGLAATGPLAKLRSVRRPAQLALTKQTAELRQQISDILIRVVERSELSMKLQECDPNNENYKVHQKRESLSEEVKLLQSDFTALEASLARLESREPRKVRLDFIEPPPAQIIGLSMEVVGEQSGSLYSRVDTTFELPPPPPCPTF